MVHRGPDEEGRYVDSSSGAALGARRLSIIDVEGGHQPLSNEDGTVWGVLNGEIYNHHELRAALARRGHRFRSSVDTEVLPHLYEEYGPEFAPLLRGMFAVAIWDECRRRLVLARDRAGEKPLLYAEVPSGFVFASELKALLTHPEVRRELNPRAVRHYFTLQYVPGPETILHGIEKLPPGHRAVVENGTLRINRYWDVVGSTPEHALSREAAISELRALLEDAVAAQMRADVPIGALLSGGIDSAGIVALMEKASQGENVRTFTVGFRDPSFDERGPAALVARHCGTSHQELLVEPPLFSQVEDLVWHMDEPVADQAALPTFLIAGVASEHVKVVLTGEGSDELFAGYPRYRWFMFAEALRRVPPRLARRMA
jgi:asparagine synthase (glutamine-hydrolysing)